MSSHARLGPSNHRWPNCPGSVREEANYVDVAGEAAIDGTGTHLLLEMCLDNNVQAIQYDQQIIGANHPEHMGGWLIDIGRINRVQMCLDYIQRRVTELKEQYPGSVVVVESESKSDVGGMFGRNDWNGTCDVTLTCTNPATSEVYFVEVIDYKDGRGWVHVPDNTQLLSYLGGKLRDFVASGPDLIRPFRPEKVGGCRMTIVQPKTNPVIRYQCSTNPEDNFSTTSVMDAVEKMSQAARATDDPDAPTRSGKWCQWCKANPQRGGHCVTATEKSLKVVTNMSTEVIATDAPAFEMMSKVIADPKSLTSCQLSELLSAEPALLASFDACRTEIQLRIEAGEHVNGYAMQAGNSKRAWNEDEETIVKKLKARRLKLDDIFPKKLISVAAVMKLDKLTDAQKKKLESDLVSTVAGKLTLKKVAHDVAQSTTDDVDSVKQMFADVPVKDVNEIFEEALSGDDTAAISFL